MPDIIPDAVEQAAAQVAAIPADVTVAVVETVIETAEQIAALPGEVAGAVANEADYILSRIDERLDAFKADILSVIKPPESSHNPGNPGDHTTAVEPLGDIVPKKTPFWNRLPRWLA
jgi:hypothetical protein